jgi:hypothetical protein
LLAAALVAGPASTARGESPAGDASSHVDRFFFTSQGKTAIINADGTGLRYFDFKVPNQATWQPGPVFPDGRRVILLVGDDRILVQVVRNMVGQMYSMHLDGSDAREFTRANEGMPYGFSISPDARRIAFHLSAAPGYQVWTSDLEGKHRAQVAAKPGHLYFGTSWSPDGKWVLYVDCQPGKTPGHDWCDVCIGKADGSEHRVLTSGGAMWFAATYGDPKTRGSGSNLPAWTRDGLILFPRRLPDSQVAWEYQPQRPDVDHFNRDFRPEKARGGTEICLLNPSDGKVTRLTHSKPPVWDFRASESADGRHIVFCRAATGAAPAVWVMDADGSNPRMITRGLEDKGVDHPRWLP